MSDDFHSQIASGAIGQNNHPAHAAAIEGGQSGGGKMMPLEGVSIDISTGGGLSLPFRSADEMFNSLNPGALGQIPNNQISDATDHMVTKSPDGKDVPALTDLGSGERLNSNAGNLTHELKHPGMGAGLGGGGREAGG